MTLASSTVASTPSARSRSALAWLRTTPSAKSPRRSAAVQTAAPVKPAPNTTTSTLTPDDPCHHSRPPCKLVFGAAFGTRPEPELAGGEIRFPLLVLHRRAQGSRELSSDTSLQRLCAELAAVPAGLTQERPIPRAGRACRNGD